MGTICIIKSLSKVRIAWTFDIYCELFRGGNNEKMNKIWKKKACHTVVTYP